MTSTVNNLIVVLSSDEMALKVYNRKADAVPDAITVLAKVFLRQQVYATHYNVMALPSVISFPVYSGYSDLESCAFVRSSIY